MLDDTSDKNCMAYGDDDAVTDIWINRHFRKPASVGVARNVVGPVAQPPLHHDDVKLMLKEIAGSSSVAAAVVRVMLLEARMAAKRANKDTKKKIAKKLAAKSGFGLERGSMAGRCDEQ
jgi:hypothetical protein